MDEIKRSDVDKKYTWNIADIYKSENEYTAALSAIHLEGELFLKNYSEKLFTKETILNANYFYTFILAIQ